jgi:hypothetical protein
MSLFQKLWIAWAMVGFAIEMIALRRPDPGDTLSEQIWNLRDRDSEIYYLLLFFFAWALFHFIFRGQRGE